jgi:uncharacterized protein (DUF433 family)
VRTIDHDWISLLVQRDNGNLEPNGASIVSATLDDHLIGVSATRAASIAGIAPARLRRWEHYGLVAPSVREKVGSRSIRLYGFRELVDLLVVRELVRITNSVSRLRNVVDDLRQEYGHPWSELRWAYDAGELYWQHPDGSWAGDRDPGQTVLHGVIDLKLIEARVRASVDRDSSTIGRIEARRGVLGSKQVIAGTRTPVAAVREYIDAGYDDAAILEAYPHLSLDDVLVVRAS